MKIGTNVRERLDYITAFDSCTSMFLALAHFLHGRDFRGVAVAENVPLTFASLLNALPEKIRVALYEYSGWLGALPERKLKKINSEEIASWVVSQYPKRKYPGVMVGSSNGAMTHLAAALGIPWLPQTFLVSFRRHLHPDEMEKDAEIGKRMASHFLPQNPDLLAYQMHDPLQDRLMVREMGYFRLKRTRLGKVWENFIKENLEPGGTIYTSECLFRWLLYPVGERHTFQIGGLGGLTAKEYRDGSPEVDNFLSHYKTKVRRWSLPQMPHEGEESEWGFVPAMFDDIQRFAKENGYRVQRIRFDDPEAVSPFVADLYRWWYERMGWSTQRMLTECFAIMEPRWTFKTESIPFWLAFNTTCSLKAMRKYLDKASFEEIYLTLMSNGVRNAIGLVPIEEWRREIKRAQIKYGFVGVEEKKYPTDLGVFLRYHFDLQTKIGEKREVPAQPLKKEELDAFLKEHGKKYPVIFT